MNAENEKKEQGVVKGKIIWNTKNFKENKKDRKKSLGISNWNFNGNLSRSFFMLKIKNAKIKGWKCGLMIGIVFGLA